MDGYSKLVLKLFIFQLKMVCYENFKVARSASNFEN